MPIVLDMPDSACKYSFVVSILSIHARVLGLAVTSLNVEDEKGGVFITASTYYKAVRVGGG
jgi:hypothetical protein